MLAMVLEAGDPQPVLSLKEIPDPRPGPGEVVVALRAAALNRRDLFIRQGKYAGIKLPAILGSDGAGVVIELGEGVSGHLRGQEVVLQPNQGWGDDPRVAGEHHRILGMPDDGTLAERVRVPAANVLPRPPHLSWDEAAALPLAGLTAYRALVSRGGVRPGETVLVPGIGSGVSTMVMLLARHLGARVLVTSGSADKLRRAIELGAAAGVNHREPDWDRKLLKVAGAPDLVVDGAGGDTFARCLGLVRPGGRVVSYGATTGAAQVEVRRIFWKQIDVLGSTMGAPAEFRQLVALVTAGELRPLVDQVTPLAEANQAFERMDRGDHMGKLVVRMPTAHDVLSGTAQ